MSNKHPKSGRFVPGACHQGEADARQPQAGSRSGRYPVASHADTKSVGSHTGTVNVTSVEGGAAEDAGGYNSPQSGLYD